MRRLGMVAVGAVVAMTVTGGAALAGGGQGRADVGKQGGPADRPSGPAPFTVQGDDDRHDAHVFELFGLQEPDETSYITVDGRVVNAQTPLPFQFPGTMFLVAELSGQNEVDDSGTPGAGDPNGTGTASVQLTLDPAELCVTMTVSDIELPAAAAHIHVGEAGVNGPVVVPLPAPGEDGTAEGCVTEGVTTEVLEQIAANPAGYYVNVHNAPYPAGAVRGQLMQDPNVVIPSPGDRTVFRERLFELDDSDEGNPEPTGEQLGTVLAECTAVTTGVAPDETSWICTRMFTLDHKGDIAVQESFTFADPIADTLAITGGTGQFRDAGGQVSFDFEEVEGQPFFNSIYTFRVLHLK